MGHHPNKSTEADIVRISLQVKNRWHGRQRSAAYAGVPRFHPANAPTTSAHGHGGGAEEPMGPEAEVGEQSPAGPDQVHDDDDLMDLD